VKPDIAPNADEMKPRSSVVFSLVLAALLSAGGAALSKQWRQTRELRAALERATTDAGELERLHEENRRLRAQQIPIGELERLRSDHAALPRLRAELEALSSPPAATR
jgi:hypothetical protein